MANLKDGIEEMLKNPNAKAKYQSKDFLNGMIRAYPTPARMDENNKWLGDYYLLSDAWGRKENDLSGLVKTDKGYDVFQMPDGYYSINPNITSLAFKTKEDLDDWYNWSGNQRANMKPLTLKDYIDDVESRYKAPNGEIFRGQDAFDNAYMDFLAASKDLENYEVGSEGHKRHLGYLGNALKYLTNYWKKNK